jgi:hypothetical protein
MILLALQYTEVDKGDNTSIFQDNCWRIEISPMTKHKTHSFQSHQTKKYVQLRLQNLQ